MEYPRLSPGGSQLAIATDDGKEANIWIYDLKSHSPIRRLTFNGRNLFPVWTPDGRYVTFQSDRDGDRAIFKQPADGNVSAERLTKPEAGTQHEPESWSRDGQMLTVNVIRGTQNTFIRQSADGKLVPLNGPLAVQKHTAFSPDGKWIAYMSSEQNGLTQVFVQPFPATGAKFQVSDTGRTPVWSADGKELFYHDPRTNRILVVDLRTSPTFSFGKATPLPIEGTIHPATQRNYDITPDGKQLVVVLPSSGARNNSTRRPPQQINVVLNWFRELQERVPVK